MYTLIAITILVICCVVIIKLFINDDKHDLEIYIGKFKFSIKKHDKTT